MEANFLALFLAALIPMVVGFIWYNPKVLQTAWMKAAKVTEDDLKTGNMALIFGLAYLFSFIFAMGFAFILVIHDSGVLGLAGGDLANFDDDTRVAAEALLAEYGPRYRTFGHGAAHGIFGAIFLILPVMVTNALFERKGWRYIFINFGYWLVTMTLMGGVVCQYF